MLLLGWFGCGVLCFAVYVLFNLVPDFMFCGFARLFVILLSFYVGFLVWYYLL